MTAGRHAAERLRGPGTAGLLADVARAWLRLVAATGGRDRRGALTTAQNTPPSTSLPPRGPAERHERPRADARVRVGVELTESQATFLRSLGRPARTGGPRGLGAKFTATGLLIAAIELVEKVELDMHGVAAGDLEEMASRAHDALLRAAAMARKTEADGA